MRENATGGSVAPQAIRVAEIPDAEAKILIFCNSACQCIERISELPAHGLDNVEVNFCRIDVFVA